MQTQVTKKIDFTDQNLFVALSVLGAGLFSKYFLVALD